MDVILRTGFDRSLPGYSGREKEKAFELCPVDGWLFESYRIIYTRRPPVFLSLWRRAKENSAIENRNCQFYSIWQSTSPTKGCPVGTQIVPIYFISPSFVPSYVSSFLLLQPKFYRISSQTLCTITCWVCVHPESRRPALYHYSALIFFLLRMPKNDEPSSEPRTMKVFPQEVVHTHAPQTAYGVCPLLETPKQLKNVSRAKYTYSDVDNYVAIHDISIVFRKSISLREINQQRSPSPR